MRDAKKRLLEPGFVSIPSSAEVWAFSCESSELERMSQLSPSASGSFRAPSSETWKSCRGTAAPASMHVRVPQWGDVGFRPLSPSVKIFDFDFEDLPEVGGRKNRVRFPIDVTGTVHAIVCWWRCFLDKGKTVVVSTSPEAGSEPFRDHWRQSVYLLKQPVRAKAGEMVRTVAYHDDIMIWFDAVEGEIDPSDSTTDAADYRTNPRGQNGGENEVAGKETATSTAEESLPAFSSGKGVGFVHEAAAPTGENNEVGCTEIGKSYPPVCLCGLHRTCSPSRIWMLNDEDRTFAFRSAIGTILGGASGTKGLDCDATRVNTRQTVFICVSDGFLLPLLAAQEGASNVFVISPSVTSDAVCRDVYRANGLENDTIRAFPGGLASFYDILSPPPGSSDIFTGLGKLDAVIGEPFFKDLSSAWPLEPLLLFWCVRTALEAHRCFSPRTRVIPARARLLACPFSCDLLFRSRRRMGTVEGISMSAVNDGLGCDRRRGGLGGALPDNGEEEEGRQTGDVESVRLQDYPYVLLSESTTLLDMDLTRSLCDLHSSRVEIPCGYDESATSGEENSNVNCHGVALWLDIWLDEEGHHRLSTGPDIPYWPQGLLFFGEAWLVPPGGNFFHLQATLENGALKVDIS